MLLRAAGEVEDEAVAVDGRDEPQLDVALDALEHVARLARTVGQFRDAGAGTPLGVVEHRGGRLAQRVGAQPLGELDEAPRADPVGGELRAQVRAALLGLAHLPGELVDRRIVEHARGDDDALLGERRRVRGHRAGHAAADVGVVGAVGGEAEQRAARPARQDGRDHRDVGQVRAACKRVVEDPRAPLGVVLAEHRGDGGGHRAEVDRDVLGLHDHLAGRVEQAARAVAALLDVRRVRAAHEHGAHLLARRAQRPGDDLQVDRVERHASFGSPARAWSVSSSVA